MWNISYPEDYAPGRYRLLELPSADYVEGDAGQGDDSSLRLRGDLIIRGQADDAAVLVDATRTFHLKEMHVSNSMLLLRSASTIGDRDDDDEAEEERDAGDDGANNDIMDKDMTSSQLPRRSDKCMHVLDTLGTMWELTATTPHLDRLKRLLALASYPQPKNADRKEFYTMARLLDAVQASEAELRAALTAFHAIELDGFWRLLDMGYTLEMIQVVIACCLADGLSLRAIPTQRALELVREYHGDDTTSSQGVNEMETDEDGCLCGGGEGADAMEEGEGPVRADVLFHCMTMVAERVEVSPESGETVVALSVAKISRLAGHLELEALLNPISVHEFTARWRNRLEKVFGTYDEEPLITDLSLLEGLHLTEVDDVTDDISIRYFPVDALAQDAVKRFARLFDVKPKWTLAEIRPYLSDLAETPKQMDLLLLKNTRNTSTAAGKVYTSRYPTTKAASKSKAVA